MITSAIVGCVLVFAGLSVHLQSSDIRDKSAAELFSLLRGSWTVCIGLGVALLAAVYL